MSNNLDFLELCERRYSVRKFSNKKVEKEKVEKILKAATLAPTACNLQPFKVIVVDSEEGLEKYHKSVRTSFGTTLVFIVIANKNECWKREYDNKLSHDIDGSIVTTHMMLEACNLGIGSTWVMHFMPEVIRKEFHIPNDFEIVSILTCGYPASDVKPSSMHFNRKDIKDIVKYNDFE